MVQGKIIAPPPGRPRLFQRHWTWWFMVAVLVVVAVARLRLLNFPLERDEGEYAYAGQPPKTSLRQTEWIVAILATVAAGWLNGSF